MDNNQFDTDTPKAVAKQTPSLINFEFHPAFTCFFQKNISESQTSYYQCYERIMKSHSQMHKLKNPLSKILGSSQYTFEQKLKELGTQSSHGERFYIHSEKHNIKGKSMFVEQKQIIANELKNQILVYKKQRQLLLAQKQEMFKKFQLQKMHQLEKEQQQQQRKKNVIEEVYKDIGHKTTSS